MRSLTESDYQIEAEPKFRQIFNYDHSYTQPFAPNVSEKLIIAPYKYTITPPLTNIIVTAASELGEKGCYFSILWRWRYPQAQEAIEPSHWYIPLTEFSQAYVGSENYPPLIGRECPYFQMMESAIYSPRGEWGIIVTHEFFALLGGTSDFIDIIRSYIPDIDQQVLEFLHYVKTCAEIYGSFVGFAWVRPLLNHIYGEEYTKILLLDSHLARWKKKGIKFLI